MPTPAYLVPLDPSPDAKQYSYATPPVQLTPPLPTGAIPAIARLMNPLLVLIAQFRNDGVVTLYCRELKGGTYQPTPPTIPITILQAGAPVAFTFTVTINTPKDPEAGLLVERADDWNLPWDDEIAYVVGGSAYPFGAAPVPAGGTTPGGVKPLNYIEGYSTPPPTGGTKTASQLVINGQSRKVISTIDELGTGASASKSLSLWLPLGVDGVLEVTQGGVTHTYTAKGGVVTYK